MTYERQFFQYLDNLKRRIYAQPMNLGGVSSSGGGVGGPPGGFLGRLPQTRVTYDALEEGKASTSLSGPSLFDNLNHIRKRLENVEASGIGIAMTVEEDDLEVAFPVTVINFEGGVSLLDEGGGKVTVTVTASGGGGPDTDAIHVNVDDEIIGIDEKTVPVSADIIVIEDSEASYAKKRVQITNLPAGSATFLDLTDVDPSSYSGQIGKSVVVNAGEDGLEFVLVSGGGAGSSGFYYIREDVTSQIPAGGDDFDLQYTPADGTAIVHYNGLTQQLDNFTVLTSGVHTEFSPTSGDELLVEYYWGNPSEGVINPTFTVKSGSTTINGVSTLNFEGMKVTDDGGGQVTVSGSISGGGTGTATGSFWSADAGPSTPSAYDDEFDDESFDSGLWTDFDEPTGLVYVENRYGLEFTSHQTNSNIQGIYQNLPASNDFAIVTKISCLWENSDDLKCGLMLLEDVGDLANSDVMYWVMAVGASGVGIAAEKFNAYNSYLGGIASESGTSWVSTFYLRLRATSGNEWHLDWSSDGIAWAWKDDWYVSGGSSHARLWVPEGMGLCIRGNTTGPRMLVHWFRYIPDGDVTTVVEGNRINYYEA